MTTKKDSRYKELVICLDPGMNLGHCGFVGDVLLNTGVLESKAGGHPSTPHRLWAMFKDLVVLFNEYKALTKKHFNCSRVNVTVVCEDVTGAYQFSKKSNTNSWLLMASYTAIFLVCGKLDLPLATFKPTQIKKSFVGKGNASKKDMVTKLKELLPDVKHKNHIADAVGVYQAYRDMLETTDA